VSQLRTYEAETIEEALRAVTMDLGEDIEIVEAVKERRGGVLGFFARESFVVTARAKVGTTSERAPEQAFGDMLYEMASEVADTWEPSRSASQGRAPEPIALVQNPASVFQPEPEANTQPTTDPVETIGIAQSPPPAQAGVIDLRTGRRRPAPMVPLITAATTDTQARQGVERPVRPSNLRRHLLGEGSLGATEQHVMEVDGPSIDLRDSVPRWSLARLEMLDLPDSIIAALERLEPARDLEWVQSLSIAISKLTPAPDAPVSHVVGHGRRSAPELVRGIPAGRIPTALIIDGVRVKATPDELALSIRACIR